MLIGVTPKKLFMGQVSLCAAVGCPMSAGSGPLSVSVLFGSLCFQKLCMSMSSVLPAFACGVCCCVAGCVHAIALQHASVWFCHLWRGCPSCVSTTS